MRSLLIVAFGVLLSSCSSIRIDTSEVRQKISQDLNLTSIIDISRMNWCVHPYGSEPGCEPDKGVGVVTPNGLVMAQIIEGKYVAKRTIKAEDITCSTVYGGTGTEGLLFAFGKHEAYMLGPMKENQKEINTAFNANMFSYLHSEGQHVFNGPEINFQRPSGRKVKQTTILNAGAATRVITEEVDVLEIYSPCNIEKNQPNKGEANKP